MNDLFQAAVSVRANAHAPYSRFQVGAAIRTASGQVFVGCNVENVAYPEGTCAEAGAIAAMVAAGAKGPINEALVIADSPRPVTPCGGCRQRLSEFGGPDMVLHLADLDGVKVTTTLGEVFPAAFSEDHFKTEDMPDG